MQDADHEHSLLAKELEKYLEKWNEIKNQPYGKN